jgi:hypothetical protein
MGQYGNEDQSLIGMARQLADAFGEAASREDEDYACDAIGDFLGEYGADAPAAALIALLDLESTDQTFPLVDRAKTLLAERGPAVVEPLLAATLGRVYDHDGPTAENALGALDSMDEGDLIQGLDEVLSGDADDELKGVAADGLAALGEPIAHDDDADDEPEDDEDVAEVEGANADDDAAEESAGGDAGGGAGYAGPAGEAAPALPDQEAVDQSYEAFLHRFESQSGDVDSGGSQA